MKTETIIDLILKESSEKQLGEWFKALSPEGQQDYLKKHPKKKKKIKNIFYKPVYTSPADWNSRNKPKKDKVKEDNNLDLSYGLGGIGGIGAL